METQKVESSNISKVGHDGKSTMIVEFKSGQSYRYSPVTYEAYSEMLNAKSVGSWFHRNIRSNKDIECNKVE